MSRQHVDLATKGLRDHRRLEQRPFGSSSQVLVERVPPQLHRRYRSKEYVPQQSPPYHCVSAPCLCGCTSVGDRCPSKGCACHKPHTGQFLRHVSFGPRCSPPMTTRAGTGGSGSSPPLMRCARQSRYQPCCHRRRCHGFRQFLKPLLVHPIGCDRNNAS